MASVKVAITLDRQTLQSVDGLVSKKVFPNRSRAIQEAVAEKLARMERSRLGWETLFLKPSRQRSVTFAGRG